MRHLMRHPPFVTVSPIRGHGLDPQRRKSSIYPAPVEAAMAFDGGPITSASPPPTWHGSSAPSASHPNVVSKALLPHTVTLSAVLFSWPPWFLRYIRRRGRRLTERTRIEQQRTSLVPILRIFAKYSLRQHFIRSFSHSLVTIPQKEVCLLLGFSSDWKFQGDFQHSALKGE